MISLHDSFSTDLCSQISYCSLFKQTAVAATKLIGLVFRFDVLSEQTLQSKYSATQPQEVIQDFEIAWFEISVEH